MRHIEQAPYISQELIDYLRDRYPDRCPSVNDSDRQIWLNTGAVGVVKHLETIFEEQNDNILRIT